MLAPDPSSGFLEAFLEAGHDVPYRHFAVGRGEHSLSGERCPWKSGLTLSLPEPSSFPRPIAVHSASSPDRPDTSAEPDAGEIPLISRSSLKYSPRKRGICGRTMFLTFWGFSAPGIDIRGSPTGPKRWISVRRERKRNTHLHN
jgi:hypothetical protein